MTHQGGPSGWPGEILYAAPGSLQPETLRTLEDSGSPAGGSQELHTRPPRSFSALWLNHVLFSPRNPSLTFKAQLTVTPGPEVQDTQFPRLGGGGAGRGGGGGGLLHSSHFFSLWCWRRLLRISWTARRSNQSTLKEINSEYSLEGIMLKLKLQYFGHLMRRASHWKRPRC